MFELTESEHDELCVWCKEIFEDQIPCNCDAFELCPAEVTKKWGREVYD